MYVWTWAWMGPDVSGNYGEGKNALIGINSGSSPRKGQTVSLWGHTQ